MPKTKSIHARITSQEANDLEIILEYLKRNTPHGIVVNQTAAIAYAITMAAIQIRQEIAS